LDRRSGYHLDMETTTNETPVTLTADQKIKIADDIATFGWTTCPCCGWMGVVITKAGKLKKHGRKQTGNGGYGCKGSGASVR
jgi:hypothetical protein